LRIKGLAFRMIFEVFEHGVSCQLRADRLRRRLNLDRLSTGDPARSGQQKPSCRSIGSR
jgi:hypothetical protein